MEIMYPSSHTRMLLCSLLSLTNLDKTCHRYQSILDNLRAENMEYSSSDDDYDDFYDSD